MSSLNTRRPDTTVKWLAERGSEPSYRLQIVRASVVTALLLLALFALVWIVGPGDGDPTVLFGP